ncbi:unnamed protein product, partial [Brenthis ino]
MFTVGWFVHVSAVQFAQITVQSKPAFRHMLFHSQFGIEKTVVGLSHHPPCRHFYIERPIVQKLWTLEKKNFRILSLKESECSLFLKKLPPTEREREREREKIKITETRIIIRRLIMY